ncbi:MAG: shikimate dehydrogenase [Alphaproteobacteria bacterium]|nr:shikimate dehydrogenase [Alphaproteobacteria bacterium]
MAISGKTAVYGVIADPIGHVRGPTIFNPLFEKLGFDAAMVPFHVSAASLPRAVAGFRAIESLKGWLVTNPHKFAMFHLCDQVDASGTRLQAVNVVRREADGRLIGSNYDGAGFITGLRHDGIEPTGMDVLMLGAGGAARAIAFALAEAGVKRLSIANRTHTSAAALAEITRKFFPDAKVEVADAIAADQDLIVNTTSAGLKPEDPLPLDATQLRSGTIVADIIMNPEMTRLLTLAKERGCRIHLGRHMLDSQLPLLARHLGVPIS